MNAKASLLKNLLAFFYPAMCPACGHALQQNEKGICLSCFFHLPETDYHLQAETPLTNIFTGRIPVETAAALLLYKKGNAVQKILHALKYKGNRQIAISLGEYYGNKLCRLEKFREIDLIIPIPLHPKKMKSRGYNQSECFAKGLSEGMKIPYATDILIRTIFTQTQTKKSRFSRWENVKEVFQVLDPGKLKDKTVILCDDVLTTGATIEAAAAELLKESNVKIFVITLATAI